MLRRDFAFDQPHRTIGLPGDGLVVRDHDDREPLLAVELLQQVEPFEDRMLRVRLEDLLAAPRDTMSKVLEFVGEPWDDAVLDVLRRQGTLGAREAALVGIDLCRALAAIHAAGLAHRDVKAQNVMREAWRSSTSASPRRSFNATSRSSSRSQAR